ncbi:mannose-6-phosphate isomerase [Tenacibaculum holothuriorum]|uniref:Mannose-6-phosphate isomerase n=1 Tax=Tenacibaculum holothuriorum TaxID=1635173 RepID=A0A1Y2PEF9_9FLAO|nr:cupin domain-containing protein [Tenacibaculum holothuriorum]OSY88884.1 mannose-6-phosphate isomerase [Tenacibaculum holothuriorum]
MSVINIQEKLNLFSDRWSPKKIGELNGQQILLAKIKGEFVFHNHENEDELFMVLKGQLLLELRDEIITLNEGEFYIVPKGVDHKPIAKEEVHLLLFEPLSTKHTGNVMADITVETYESI